MWYICILLVKIMTVYIIGIHGYTVNDRLFTEPMTVDADGNSVCPSCTRPRKDPTPESPGFVRYLSVWAVIYFNANLHMCPIASLDKCSAGFPCLLESPGLFSLKFPRPGKPWKMSLVLGGPGICLWFNLTNMPFMYRTPCVNKCMKYSCMC